MNIIEVKNNLVKLSYVEDVMLSSFIKISDVAKAYIAQIIHIESTRIGKIAYARLIFNFQSTIKAYDGSIPSIQADVEILDDSFLVKYFDKKDGLLLGKTSIGGVDVIVSSDLLKDKPIICSEKTYQSNVLIENILKQNELKERKTVVIDLSGEIKGNKIVATKDFKLPLNHNSLNYIFESGFDDLTPENQAFIQDVFSEISEYIKTVEYISFKDFSAVIDYEFNRTHQLKLIILKNRLSEFGRKGLFAETKKDFAILDEKLVQDNTLIIDLSLLDSKFQQEYITYIYQQMTQKNNNFYAMVQLENNSSESLLHTILGAKNVFSSYICPYAYKHLSALKQCSKNLFMFTPIRQGHDFGAYNVFINRLAEDEFVLYGKTTKFIPLILKMEQIQDFSSILNPEPENVEEEGGLIRPTLPQMSTTPIIVPEQVEQVEEVSISEDESEIVEDSKIEIKSEDNVVEQIVEPVEEQEQEVEIPDSDAQNIEPTTENDEAEDINTDNIEKEMDFADISIDISDEEILTEIEKQKPQEEPDELSDDDLDFIEELSEYDELVEEKEVVEETIDTEPKQLSEIATEELDLEEELLPEENIIEDVIKEQEDIVVEESVEEVQEEELVNSEELGETLEDVESSGADFQAEDIVEHEYRNESVAPRVSITDEIIQEELKKQEELKNQPKVNKIEKHIEPPTNKSGLETKIVDTPEVPVYSAEIPDEDLVESDPVQQGDVVVHPEFGRGVVEKIINYGDRTLCSVNFEQIGRRLLDPKVSELRKEN